MLSPIVSYSWLSLVGGLDSPRTKFSFGRLAFPRSTATYNPTAEYLMSHNIADNNIQPNSLE